MRRATCISWAILAVLVCFAHTARAQNSAGTLDGSSVWAVDNLLGFRHEKSNLYFVGYPCCFGVFRAHGAGAELRWHAGYHRAHYADGGAAGTRATVYFLHPDEELCEHRQGS